MLTHPAPRRYLALGDSYTIGEGVPPEERWPQRLVRALAGAGVALADPEVIARTGWTTDELAAAVEAARPQGPYALVSLLVGVNNQYRGRPVAEYGEELRGLLERAVGFAGGAPGRVVVLSIPDWGVTPFAEGRDRAAIAREIDAYNAVARRLAADGGARWVDVTPVSREHGAEPAMLAPDGLHPSGEMYALWTARALPQARAALGEEAAR